MSNVLKTLKQLVREEEGQAMAEYGLVMALVAVAAISALGIMGTDLKALITALSGKLTGNTPTP